MEEYFPYEWPNTPNKLAEQQLPSYDEFYSKLKKSHPLDKEFHDYQKLLNNGINEEQAFSLKNESCYTTGTQKKNDCFSVDAYCNQ